MSTSVWISILAVASSIRIILLFFKMARAIQINYFSPALKLDPPSFMSVSNPDLYVIKSIRQHYLATSINSVS